MNTNKIRQTIAERSQAAGLDPTGPLGYADLLGFGKRYNSKGRVGLLGVPEQAIEDKDKFFSNPMAQIDAGISLMKQVKDQGGNDFDAMLQYTGDPEATVRAMIRGTKYSGQPLTAGMIAQAAQAAGVEIDPIAEARKAGVELAPDEPEQMAPEPQMAQAAQQMPPEQMQEPEMPVPESTPDQRKSRLQQAFGARGQTSGLSDELNTYLRKMI
jgi:hypothetical protein